MKVSSLACALSLASYACLVRAAESEPASSAWTTVHTNGEGMDVARRTARGHRQEDAKALGQVNVTAALDKARNDLSPDTGSSQYVIDAQSIQALPLGASTPLNQILLQAPGVVQNASGQVHVRGDHANLQYRIDGIMLPESITGFGQTLDPHMIESLKLLDGALPAQYGERTAAVVDITTKRGADLGNGGIVGITGGSFGAVNPYASRWGSHGNLSYFLNISYLENDLGIENPTRSRKPIHDHTSQAKAFGDISYQIDSDTRLSVMFGIANNRFQLPNNPNQTPNFGYLDQSQFNSADLNERQNEQTRFGVLALKGKLGKTAYRIAAGQRYSGLQYYPDEIGDLMFNGVASQIKQTDRAFTLQADFARPWGGSHTLRYGLYYEFDRALVHTDSLVFAANPDGSQASTVPFGIYTGNRILAKTAALYAQDEWEVTDALTLNYGLRADRYSAFREESQLSPRVGLVWQVTDSTVVHAGYSRYFTPPQSTLISTQDIDAFAGTTNAVKNYGNNTPLTERSNYFDVGMQQRVGDWTLGLDAYYRAVSRLQDEGQFGAARVYSTFNYKYGRVRGAEFTLSYNHGPFLAYFNAAYSRAMGKDVITSQYNFDPDELAYIASHWIHLDHDQTLTSSGGISYAFDDGTRLGADYLLGSGLRQDGAVPNGRSLPLYFQLNLSVAHDFQSERIGKFHAKLAIINALDRSYRLSSGTGVGAGAPQYGPRRGVYLTLEKPFSF